VVICPKRGADCLHMVQLMPLHPKTPSSLVLFKSTLVLPFWYRLTQVVLENRPLNGSSNVVVCSAEPCEGSVATYARCGGIISKHFTGNSLKNLPVKQW